MTEEKAVFFDSQVDADWADAPYGAVERPKLDRLFFRCGSLEGCRVLEPGCGTGRLTELLASAVGPDGFVHACDISLQMVQKAQKRVGSGGNVMVYHGAMEDLDLPEGSLDMVVCHQVFPHFDNKPRALEYIASALRPFGKLIIAHFECRDVINDVHRKAGTVVEYDNIPEENEMLAMLASVGMKVRYYSDDREMGYLLEAY